MQFCHKSNVRIVRQNFRIYTKGHQSKIRCSILKAPIITWIAKPHDTKPHSQLSSLNRNSSPVIVNVVFCNNTLLGGNIPTEHVLSCILFHVICQLFKGGRAVSGAKDPRAHCVTLIISLKNKTDIQFR